MKKWIWEWFEQEKEGKQFDILLVRKTSFSDCYKNLLLNILEKVEDGEKIQEGKSELIFFLAKIGLSF